MLRCYPVLDFLEESEWKLVEKELLIMLEEVKKGNFTIEDGVEDVHSQVEFNLTRKSEMQVKDS